MVAGGAGERRVAVHRRDAGVAEQARRRRAIERHHEQRVGRPWRGRGLGEEEPAGGLPLLYEHAARLTGDPAFGLRVGLESHPGMFDVLGHAVMSCDTLGRGFDTIARYQRVLQDGAEVRLAVDGRLARVSYTIVDPTVGPCRQEIEATIGILVGFLRSTFGADFVPRGVELAHPAPADPRVHHELLGAPIAFDAPTSSLAFDAALLERAMPRRDPVLSAILERQLRDALARLPAHAGLVGDVRAAIAPRLPRGEPAVTEIGRALGMSARTLQRRLQEQGASFGGILDDVRRELALRYLQDRARETADAAFLLGYADLSAFHRAFRRWTGRAPGEWRRAHAPP